MGSHLHLMKAPVVDLHVVDLCYLVEFESLEHLNRFLGYFEVYSVLDLNLGLEEFGYY